MSSSGNNLANLRKNVHQLKRELAVKREKVSVVSKELVEYCQTHAKMDVLVSGFKSQKQNPFAEQKGCNLI